MAKNLQPVAVKDVVYKLQNFLLEGSSSRDQLFAAGSIMSRGDYEDVVTERSISKLCGYPLCGNPLPSDRTRKGRYRISLNEHKVYDLNETCLYCSSSCVVNSRAFATSLQTERCLALNPAKVDGILRLFGELKLEPEEDVDKLELSKLKIQENEEVRAEEVSMGNWAGPSNAIEGYVPKKDSVPKLPPPKKKQGAKPNNAGSAKQNLIVNDFEFVSTIITQDEYNVSKSTSTRGGSTSKSKGLAGKGSGVGVVNGSDKQETPSAEKNKVFNKTQRESNWEKNEITLEDIPSVSNASTTDSKNGLIVGKSAAVSSQNKLKSSLKSTGTEKGSRCVTWGDEKDESPGSGSLYDIKENEDAENHPVASGDADVRDKERLSSAEAIAMALNQAAEAVASGKSDAMHAVSEAGLVILPHPLDQTEEESVEDPNELETDPGIVKWPRKPVIPLTPFDSEDSWFDAPPEEFSLTLSPFATMWGTLFSWITSSSVAYIYGQDESFHEDYLSVNNRSYPVRVELPDGRSSEIKQTVASCLSRATPGLVADFRLRIPVSVLEQGLAHLLDTMSFMDAVPALRARQWQVILLLLLDALSVSRITVLTDHMTNRRALITKVLDGAQINVEEYEIMKDLLMPLGRAPQFSAQSGA